VSLSGLLQGYWWVLLLLLCAGTIKVLGFNVKERLASGGATATGRTAVVGLGLVLVTIVVAVSTKGTLGARLALTSMGLFVGSLALLRAPALWDDVRVEGQRDLGGDRAVVLFYVLLGVAAIVYAWAAPLP